MKSAVISLLIMNILTSYGHIIIKYASKFVSLNKNPLILFRQFLRPDLISGFFAVLAAPLFYFHALKTLQLNTAYSFTALNQILIPGLSIILFREKINIRKIIAVILITSGIIIWNL